MFADDDISLEISNLDVNIPFFEVACRQKEDQTHRKTRNGNVLSASFDLSQLEIGISSSNSNQQLGRLVSSSKINTSKKKASSIEYFSDEIEEEEDSFSPNYKRRDYSSAELDVVDSAVKRPRRSLKRKFDISTDPSIFLEHKDSNETRAVSPEENHYSKIGPILYQSKSSLKDNAIEWKTCKKYLRVLMKHKYGWIFNSPVDPIALKIPDYFDVIKYPMDLGTINNRLVQGYYLNIDQFISDVKLVFNNAMTYNPPASDIFSIAKDLLGIFEKSIASFSHSNVDEIRSSSPHKSELKVKDEQKKLKIHKKEKRNYPKEKSFGTSLSLSNLENAVISSNDSNLSKETVTPTKMISSNSSAMDSTRSLVDELLLSS